MRSAIVLLAIVCSVSLVHAQEKQWSWFVASSVADDWNLEKGTAKIQLTQTSFRAELYIGNYLRHRIIGSRDGDRIKAKLSTSETDQVDYPLTGTYQRRLWKDHSTAGRETITLSWGGIVVGFVREIAK